ncbi:MAG: hypothetical protein V3V40_05110 [Nitrosomonadaceae bacterium]
MKTKAIAIVFGIFLCGTAQAEWVEFVLLRKTHLETNKNIPKRK